MRNLLVMTILLVGAHVGLPQTFTATLTGEQVVRGGEAGPTLPWTAFAEFELVTNADDPGSTSLNYSLFAPDFDFDGLRTADLSDDVTAVHLHTLTDCVDSRCIPGDTAGTKHVLNIFGAPREDDADLVIESAESLIRGIWDPADANMLTPAPTADPNDLLDELRNGQLFIMIHTRAFPTGAIGGVLVPEPSTFGSVAFWGLLLLSRQASSQRDSRRKDRGS